MDYNKNGLFIPPRPWSKLSNKEVLKYAVGALLYAPANHPDIAKYIINKNYKRLKSVALCLEDSINDSALPDAERKLLNTLNQIYNSLQSGQLSIDDLPLIFIRIRSPKHINKIVKMLGKSIECISGFVAPKVDGQNIVDYKNIILDINSRSSETIYIMPIIESGFIMDKGTRYDGLYNIKSVCDDIKDYVLNIRVGGNDFCNIFGIRRSVNQNIYDIGVVRDALVDVINVFGRSYVVSGPVWEYFDVQNNSDLWKEGLIKELELDKLNGFIGKTSIHPSQLEVIQDFYVVSHSDYTDALSIINWESSSLAVEKSAIGRMNEMKVHSTWALKTLALAEIYGVKK